MDESQEQEEIEPSKLAVELVRCTSDIKDIFESVPGEGEDYAAGKAYMREAASVIEKNPVKTLRLMRKAQEAVQEESKIISGLREVKARRASIPDYVLTKEEMKSESEIIAARQKQNWKKAQSALTAIMETARIRAGEAIDQGTHLMIEDIRLLTNRPATINLIIVNGSAFAMKIVNMTAVPEKQVSIFNEYRKTIAPGGQLTVRMNVTGLTEGDMVVEVKAEVETEGRRTFLTKQASLKVEAPPIAAARTVVTAEAGLRNPNGGKTPPSRSNQPAAQSSSDPMSMINDAIPQDWVNLLVYCQENSIPLDLAGISSVDHFELKKGYRSLLQAILVMPYQNSMTWTIWYDDSEMGGRKGIIGDDFTRRVAPLLFEMASSKDRSVRFENDGGIGSSNKEKLTTALHIASGTISLPKEKVREIRSWDFKVTLASGDIDVGVQKTAEKDENGKNLKTVFQRVR